MVDTSDSEPAPDEVHCTECGQVIERGVTYCSKCGARQDSYSNSNTKANSAEENLPHWHDDGVVSRYVKFWGDKRSMYQLVDLVMLVVSAGFFIGWIGMEAVQVHNREQDWDGASNYYADIEEGELVG